MMTTALNQHQKQFLVVVSNTKYIGDKMKLVMAIRHLDMSARQLNAVSHSFGKSLKTTKT